MLGDSWPEEPDEPFDEYGDPEETFDLDIPDAGGVSKELFRAFWGLVAVFNVALFAVSLGALLLVFRGAWIVGGALLAIGIVSTAYGLHRYRFYRDREPWDD